MYFLILLFFCGIFFVCVFFLYCSFFLNDFLQFWVPSENMSRVPPKDWVVSVAFSPDAQFLASGSNDATIRAYALAPIEARTSVRFGTREGVSQTHKNLLR